MITITPKAAKRISALAAKKGKPGAFLRVKVTPGGCSGLSYAFEIDDKPLEGDLVTELDGAKAVVDPKSDEFLKGAEVDFVDSLMKSAFEISNPNATGSCSCGTSFTTEKAAPVAETFEV